MIRIRSFPGYEVSLRSSWSTVGRRASDCGKVAVVCLMMATGMTLSAQDVRNPPDTLKVNDSVVVAVVGQVIVEKSAHLFLRAALEGTQVPFQVTLPEGATSPRWQAFLDHLMLSLRGRDLQTPDNLQYIIEIRGLSLGTDTMRIWLHVGIRWRCRDQWIIDGNSYEVSWVRQGNDSNWYRMKTELEIHDWGLCPADPE
jgi:hypothetical protein